MVLRNISRRGVLTLAGAAALAPGLALADDDEPSGPPFADVSGQLPDLKFQMSLASTGAPVTAAHFAGHPVILYFGFTRCTDTCPLTMENAAKLVRKMGNAGQDLRVLFVTIDPVYDSLPKLKTYMANFGPAPVFDGLRGTNDQLAAMAKLYGVQYTAVTDADTPDPVAGITHSIAVYGFGPQGQARYILGTLAEDKPDLDMVASLMTPLTKA
jgi:protein SCO1/2